MCYNAALQIIKKKHRAHRRANFKNEKITEAIAPTIMDGTTTIVNSLQSRSRVQKILHSHQQSFRSLGGCYNNTKLKHVHANPSTLEGLKKIEGNQIEKVEANDCFYLGNALADNSCVGKEKLLKKTKIMKEGMNERSFITIRDMMITCDLHFTPDASRSSLTFNEPKCLKS